MIEKLVLPEPIGLQPQWLDSPASRKVVRVGRRGSKTRFALIAAIAGHGPGEDGNRMFPGIAQGGDVIWVAQDYPNLTRVVWQEELKPRLGHLPWCTLTAHPPTAKINGKGTLHLVSAEAINGIRGMGSNVVGIIIDEAAWLDLENALQDVILAILLDNNGWLIIMSTTNAGPDGNTLKRVPSYFNVICTQIRAGERGPEWVEFHGTAFDNPVISDAAINELIAEYSPDSPKLKQEVYAELLVAGIGLALPKLDAVHHIVQRFTVPSYWPQFGGFDWGYNHPWTFGWYASDGDGNIVCIDTVSGREDQVEEIITTMRATGAPFDHRTFAVYSGKDIFTHKGRAIGFHGPTIAERMLLAKIKVVEADIGRVQGLENLRAYIDYTEEKEPRFTLMDTAGNRAKLAQLQQMQVDPKNLEDALKMDADISGRGGDDFYDECIHPDTLIDTAQGPIRIADLVGAEGEVWTPWGLKRFSGVRQTHHEADLLLVEFANGKQLRCTANHPILLGNGRWVAAGDLEWGYTAVDCGGLLGYNTLHGSGDSQRDDTTLPWTAVLADEGRLLSSSGQVVTSGSVEGDPWPHTHIYARSPQGPQPRKQRLIESGNDSRIGASAPAYDATAEGHPPGTLGRQSCGDHEGSDSLASVRAGRAVASSAYERHLERQTLSDSGMPTVREGIHDAHNERLEVLPSELQGQGTPGTTTVVTRIQLAAPSPVYNMEVEDVHCYSVNGGIVVHNCRYALMSRPLRAKKAVTQDLSEHKSVGYDYDAGKPRHRQTATEMMDQLFQRARPAAGGRYSVPRK